MRRVAVALFSVAAVGLAVLALVLFAPFWPLSLLEHFRIQIIVAALPIVAGAVALLAPFADCAVVALLLQWLLVAPDLLAPPRPVPDGVPLRVLALNVHTEGASFAQVAALITDMNADVVGLVEVDQRWLAALAPALAGYPGRIEHPRGDNFGVALYTRGALIGAIETPGDVLPVAVGVLSSPPITLVLVHPPPPVASPMFDLQKVELSALASRIRGLSGTVAVMGDFNATPWSRPYRRFLSESGLCDSRPGFGIGATFPSDFALLRIPLDHLFVSCTAGVAGRRVERDVGSDHLPIVVDLVVPR